MVTATATISAAIADEVRLADPETSRGPSRPSGPMNASRREAVGINRWVSQGVVRASPIVTPNMQAKLAPRLSSTVARSTPEATAISAPKKAARARIFADINSSCERDKIRLGGDLAASQAGNSAAKNVAARPSRPPLIKLDVVDRLRNLIHRAATKRDTEQNAQQRAEQAHQKRFAED